MLPAMIEGWALWLFLVGLAVGIVTSLLVVVRLPRGEADVTEGERPAEAAWIGSIIERHGGIAPQPLVEEVLDLHQAYLQRRRLPDVGGVPWAPVPAAPPPGYTSMPALPPGNAFVPAPPRARPRSPGNDDPRSQRPG